MKKKFIIEIVKILVPALLGGIITLIVAYKNFINEYEKYQREKKDKILEKLISPEFINSKIETQKYILKLIDNDLPGYLEILLGYPYPFDEWPKKVSMINKDNKIKLENVYYKYNEKKEIKYNDSISPPQLKERIDQYMSNADFQFGAGNYLLSLDYYQDVLKLDKNNEKVLKQIKEIKNILKKDKI
jgi:hypothetical protein